MAIISITCSKCGALVDYDHDRGRGKCPFCGTQYENMQSIQNTIINNTTQVVRTNILDNSYESLLGDCEQLINLKQYRLVEEKIKNLLACYSEDSRSWLLYIKFELSQFDSKYEYKAEDVSVNINTSRIIAQLKAGKPSRKYYSGLLAEKEIRYGKRFNNYDDDYCSDAINNPNKESRKILDDCIVMSIHSLLGCGDKESIGDFIIAKEDCGNGLAGYSYCYFGNNSTIVLPNFYNDCRIKLNRDYNFSQIQNFRVIVPKETECIESEAFKYCAGVQKIEIPSKKISIKTKAFENCITLESIRISSQIESIQKEAFVACPNLRKLVIAAEELDVHTSETINNLIIKTKYYGSGNILAIQLEKINRLQERIFFNNPRITHVTTKNANFLHISKRDFAIVISCDDIDLGYQAFCGCSLLKTINLDAKKINISDECFSGCIKLMSCKITTNELKIGEAAFSRSASKGIISLYGNKRNYNLNRFWKKGTKAKIKFFELQL